MSSTPHSPPDTPSKQAMATGKENIKPRTRQPDETIKKSESQMDEETTKLFEEPSDEIQVPGTAPIREDEAKEKPKELSAWSPVEAEEKESAQIVAEDPDAELLPFNWEEFRNRYHAEMNTINDEEDAIMKKFDLTTQAFGCWAEGAANRDNERARKRLKTRERYVELSESALKQKTERYIQVVSAFKNALDMLRGSG